MFDYSRTYVKLPLAVRAGVTTATLRYVPGATVAQHLLRSEDDVTRRDDPLETLLGPLEQDVMDVIWTLGDATVRDVHDVLADRRRIAYTTVMTTMTRLATKKLLVRDTSGLAHRYRPAVSRERYARSTLQNVLSWALERYPEPAAAYLAEVVDDVDAGTLDQIREAVERRRSEES
jgi:predicted transcriptional regulator